MNGVYYPNTSFKEERPRNTNQVVNQMPIEQSYIENILRANLGKKVRAYMSYTDSKNWTDKIFSGVIEGAGRDHLILSDPNTGLWYLLKLIYLDYIEFDEKIKYGL